MRRFLAMETLSEDVAQSKEQLRRLAEAAHDAGLRAVETFLSPGWSNAFTLFEAETADSVRIVHERAGLPVPEVIAAERIHTDLLDQPRRAR